MSGLPTEEARRLSRGNRRATVRYSCAPATVGRVYFPDDHQRQCGWIHNLSRTGVGVVLDHSLPIGMYLIVRMRGADGKVDLPAHVIHSTLRTESNWLIGCELLTPLTEDALESLL